MKHTTPPRLPSTRAAAHRHAPAGSAVRRELRQTGCRCAEPIRPLDPSSRPEAGRSQSSARHGGSCGPAQAIENTAIFHPLSVRWRAGIHSEALLQLCHVAGCLRLCWPAPHGNPPIQRKSAIALAHYGPCDNRHSFQICTEPRAAAELNLQPPGTRGAPTAEPPSSTPRPATR